MSEGPGTYKPTENDGLREDGKADPRTSSEHGFGSRRGQASEVGKEGGKKGGQYSDLDPDGPRKEDGEFNPDAPQV